MADPKSDSTPGHMDIGAHEKTFAGFIRIAVWIGSIAIGGVIFMALANG